MSCNSHSDTANNARVRCRKSMRLPHINERENAHSTTVKTINVQYTIAKATSWNWNSTIQRVLDLLHVSQLLLTQRRDCRCMVLRLAWSEYALDFLRKIIDLHTAFGFAVVSTILKSRTQHDLRHAHTKPCRDIPNDSTMLTTRVNRAFTTYSARTPNPLYPRDGRILKCFPTHIVRNIHTNYGWNNYTHTGCWHNQKIEREQKSIWLKPYFMFQYLTSDWWILILSSTVFESIINELR